jgi:hypothetical protein
MTCSDCRSHERRLKIAREDLWRHIEKYQKDGIDDLWVEYSALYVREVEVAYDRHMWKAHKVRRH